MKVVATFFWQRLDQPGLDSCRLIELASGWRLDGAAVFREGRQVCHLSYTVAATPAFRTTRARVSGRIGNRPAEFEIRSAGRGRWIVNGRPHPAVAGCLDVDLGFTPATNLLAIRRLALKVGESAGAPAAYLEVPRMRVVTLPQFYKRTGARTYAYQSPTVGYQGSLRVSRLGAVTEYPGVFRMLHE